MIILLQTLNFTLAELKLKNLNLLKYLSKSLAQQKKFSTIRHTCKYSKQLHKTIWFFF